MKSLKLVSLLILSEALFFGSAWAQSKLSLPPAGSTPVSASQLQIKKPSPFTTSVEFEHFSFISANKSYFNSEENAASLSTLGMSVQSSTDQIPVDAAWLYVPQEESHYVNIREFSYRLKRVSGATFRVGRHRHTWSQGDLFWHTGFWEPQFKWNGVRPETQGFTGLFLQKRWPQLSVSTFASPVFLPDQTPTYIEEDGKLTSRNPWFRTPPPAVNLWDRLTPLEVSVREPTVSDVVFQPSLAVQLEKNWSENLSSQLAYTYKPMNSPRLVFDYYLHTRAATSIAVATVQPEFPYHHVLTAESVWSMPASLWAITPSITHDEPRLRSHSVDLIAQDFSPSTVMSLTASRSLADYGDRRGRYYMGMMKVWTKFLPDRGDNAPADSQFDLRLPYYLAGRVGLERSFQGGPRNELKARTEITYDFEQEAGVWTSAVDYEWKRVAQVWRLGVEMNLIGVLTERENNYEKGFLRAYRANDAVGVNLSYVH